MYIHAEGNKKYIYANQYVEVGGFSAGHATTAGRFREGDGPSFFKNIGWRVLFEAGRHIRFIGCVIHR